MIAAHALPQQPAGRPSEEGAPEPSGEGAPQSSSEGAPQLTREQIERLEQRYGNRYLLEPAPDQQAADELACQPRKRWA